MGPMVRRYVQALSEVLAAARGLVAEQQADWCEANREALGPIDIQGFTPRWMRDS